MEYKIYFILLLLIPLIFSCRESGKKSFNEQAHEIIKDVKDKNKFRLLDSDFSQGVQEIAEPLYIDPLIAEYSDILTIESTEEFNRIKNMDPNSIRAIFIDRESYGKEIGIDNISVFKNLEYLKVKNLPCLPNGFYELENLKVFIGIDQLWCTMDERITNLNKLEYIALKFDHLELAPEISTLKNLKTLIISRGPAAIWKQPYSEIYEIPNLETLQLGFDKKEQLKGISKLSKLRIFITNRVIAEVGNLNIQGLLIEGYDNKLYPQDFKSFPKELSNLKNLVALKILNTSVVSAPNFIHELKNLEYLFLLYNDYDIPMEYSKLPKLKILKIACKRDSCDQIISKFQAIENVKFHQYD